MSAMTATRGLAMLALAVGALAYSSHGASAQYFGAIGYSQSSGALGWGFDYPTRNGAEEAAMANCSKYAADCKIAVWFKDGCGVIAVGDRYGFGTAYDQSRAQAERMALIACRSETKNCTVLRWVCTTNAGY